MQQSLTPADLPVATPTPSPHDPPRRQVTLRGLFLSTTYFAISSALAAKFGLGIFVLMNGIFLTLLSFRGFLWWMQTKKARPRTFRVAWLLFAISFALPALSMKGCGTGPPQINYGWQAAVFAAVAVTGTLDDLSNITREPKTESSQALQLAAQFLFALFLNLPNALMLLSPLVLYREQRDKGQALSLFFHCAALSTWIWGLVGGTDLRIGYYVWSSAITGVAMAKRPGWKTLATLAALSLLLLIWAMLK